MLPTQGQIFVHVVWAQVGKMHEVPSRRHLGAIPSQSRHNHDVITRQSRRHQVSDSAIDDEIEVKVMLKRAKGLLAADKGGTSRVMHGSMGPPPRSGFRQPCPGRHAKGLCPASSYLQHT